MMANSVAAKGYNDTVWLLEPNESIQRLVSLALAAEGIAVDSIDSVDDLEQVVDRLGRAVVLLDVGLARESAVSMINRIKSKSQALIIAMTAAGPGEARRALEAGADDILAMPFDPDDLVDRIQFLLGRPKSSDEDEGVYVSGGLAVDLRARRCRMANDSIPLSKTEWNILRVLARHSQQPVLMSEIAGASFDRMLGRDEEYVRAWMERLKDKVRNRDGRSAIQQIHGIAWALSAVRSPDRADGR